LFLADFAAGSFLPMSWKRLLKAEAGGAGADQFLEAVLNFAKAMFEICCKIFALYIKEHFG
jgi:hypothetical protein